MSRFRELRRNASLTQEELIDQFNERYGRRYSAAAISQFEHDVRIPATESLKDFADFYGVTIDYLLGEPDTDDEGDLHTVFGARLSRILEERDMTQRDLAKLVGVAPATVNDWVKGRITPLMRRVDKICAALSVDRADLMGQENGRAADGKIDFLEYIDTHNTIRFGGKKYHLDKSDKEALEDAMRAALHRVPTSSEKI